MTDGERRAGHAAGSTSLDAIDRGRVGAAVSRHARRTPLLRIDDLSDRLGCDVWVKAECLQPTGSFKVRGAAARLDALGRGERQRGVVTCSSGNHGRALAFVAGRMGIPARVFVPEWVDPVKLAGIREAGAEAILAGATYDESEALAVEDARLERRTFVSAYDDPWVIVGQGTVADEILEDLDIRPSHVLVPLSGGGLAAGIASTLWARAESIRASTRVGAAGRAVTTPSVVAVSAENAAVMLASVRAGHPVELPERKTLANALAGGIGMPNRYSFALVRDRVAEHVSVTENAIADAMRFAVGRLRMVVEGGGAVGLAAVLSCTWPHAPVAGPVVIVLSGGNVDLATLAAILQSPDTGTATGGPPFTGSASP